MKKRTIRKYQKHFSLQWWMAPLGVVVIACLVAGGIVVHSLRANNVPTKLNCPSDPDNFSCYKEQLVTMTTKKGPEQAFVALKAGYQTNSYVVSQCHQLTHVIGQTAAKIYPDVGVAYKHGDNFCWSGYYHGVMQGIAAKVGIANLKAEANSICTGVAQGSKKYGFDHFNCVHGLGHGFMGVQANELFTSLKTCDALSDSWERQSCYGGVFMENVMAFQSATTHTKYLKTGDPLYPCTAVDTAYKEQCYLMQTSHALTVEGGNFSKVFAVCATVPEAQYQLTCYQSLGRDASGQSNSNAVTTKATCLLGPTESAQSNCFIGAVKDFISYFHGETQGLALCNSLSDYPNLQSICLTTARDYYSNL